MSRRYSLLLLVTLVFTATDFALAQDIPQLMSKVFGKQFRDYQWFNYPVDNFGVATSYQGKGDSANPKNFLCATFTCVHVTPPSDLTKTDDLHAWLKVAPSAIEEGYADEGCGGPVQAALTRNSGLALRALLPQLLSVVGITFDLDRDRQTKAILKFKSACNRLLLGGKYRKFINASTSDPLGLREALSRRELVVVKGDVVITGIEISIEATGKLKTDLEAKAQGAAASKLGKDSQGTVSITRNGTQNFTLALSSPLVVGILPVYQKETSVGVAGGSAASWNGWAPTRVPDPTRR